MLSKNAINGTSLSEVKIRQSIFYEISFIAPHATGLSLGRQIRQIMKHERASL